MKTWCLLFPFCILSTLLIGQNGATVLDKLEAGETIEIDWVQQQYLSDLTK